LNNLDAQVSKNNTILRKELRSERTFTGKQWRKLQNSIFEKIGEYEDREIAARDELELCKAGSTILTRS
jgi:hypothetical protein